MKHRFLVNPPRLVVSLGILLVLAVLTGVMIHLGRPLSIGIFGALTLIYAAVALEQGAVITVGPEGVERHVLGVLRKRLRWDQIGEIGVGGTRVLRDPDSKRVGTLYLYFSEKALTEEERFQLLLRWPHWNQCYLLFSHARVRAVQMLWDREIQTCNVGDLSLNEGLKN